MPANLRHPLSIMLGALATTALGGCYYGDVYGSSYAAAGGDCSARYGDGYYEQGGYAYDDGYGYDCYDARDYSGGFVQIGFGGGWYDDYYYPGYGLWLFDGYNNRYPLRGQYLNYWGGRRAWWKHHGGRGNGDWRGRDRDGDGDRDRRRGRWKDRDRDDDGRRGTRPGRGPDTDYSDAPTPPTASDPVRPIRRDRNPGAGHPRGDGIDRTRPQWQGGRRNRNETMTAPPPSPAARPALPTTRVAPAPAVRAAPPPPAARAEPAPRPTRTNPRDPGGPIRED